MIVVFLIDIKIWIVKVIFDNVIVVLNGGWIVVEDFFFINCELFFIEIKVKDNIY